MFYCTFLQRTCVKQDIPLLPLQVRYQALEAPTKRKLPKLQPFQNTATFCIILKLVQILGLHFCIPSIQNVLLTQSCVLSTNKN